MDAGAWRTHLGPWDVPAIMPGVPPIRRSQPQAGLVRVACQITAYPVRVEAQ
jgi:hypothetical protein